MADRNFLIGGSGLIAIDKVGNQVVALREIPGFVALSRFDCT